MNRVRAHVEIILITLYDSAESLGIVLTSQPNRFFLTCDVLPHGRKGLRSYMTTQAPRCDRRLSKRKTSWLQ